MSIQVHNSNHPKAVIFDLMGTCLDWHSSITPILGNAIHRTTNQNHAPPPSEKEISHLALQWRQGFFEEIHARFEDGQPQEYIEETHRRVLERSIADPNWTTYGTLSDEAVAECVAAWHEQQAWSDVVAALSKLRSRFDVVVLANGTTRHHQILRPELRHAVL